MNKTLVILPTAEGMGVIRAREVEVSPEKKIVYIAVDPEKETESLAENVKDLWLVYRFKPKEKTNEPTETFPKT